MRNNNVLEFGKKGFTLAEMMVVMLILSIIMAAFAPIMTRRNKAEMNAANNTLWKYAEEGSSIKNIYYSNTPGSVVMIGTKLQTSEMSSHKKADLMLNTNNTISTAISFMNYGSDVGYLSMTNNKLYLGSLGSGVSEQDDTVAIGPSVTTSGINSTIIGFEASGDNSDATVVGHQANTGGEYSTVIGAEANASGDNTTLIGYNTKALGADSIAIGKDACARIGSYTKTICIGSTGERPATVPNEDIYIGTSKTTNAKAAIEAHTYGSTKTGVVINGDLLVNGNIYGANGVSPSLEQLASKTFYTYSLLGFNATPYYSNSSGTFTYTSSDRRLKNISGENNDGLDKLSQLNVFNFTFKNDKKKLPHVGVIAQDLQKVFPNAVIKGKDGYLMIRWDEMFYCMINSVKELAQKVTGLDTRVTKLEQQNKQLEAQNKLLIKRLNALEKKVK